MAWAWRLRRDLREARAAGTTGEPGVLRGAQRRLFIAPVNSAGQGYAWARASERVEGTAAAAFMYRDPNDTFGFLADSEVPTVFFRTNRPWQRAQRRAVAARFTHVIVESGRQLFGTDEPLADQLRRLQRHRVAVALLWHGSDIRLPSAHAAREPDSPFRGSGYADTDRLEEIAQRGRALMADVDAPVFVSTPDLLDEVPQASWLPVVVDLKRWEASSSEIRWGAKPIVVHVPSNAGLKGSSLIGATMRRLHAEGLVDYRELRNVPAAQMPAEYGRADIVLDQFALGIYGVAACEAMASGRLVISHVSDQVRDAVRVHTGRELPILQARADGLEGVLRAVVAEPDRFIALAATGREFVRAVHDGRRSANVLREFLGAPAQGGVAGA